MVKFTHRIANFLNESLMLVFCSVIVANYFI